MQNHLISGLILDCSNERTESVDGILYAFAAVVGVPLDKVSYRPASNALEEAMSITYVSNGLFAFVDWFGRTRLRPTLARALLGWEPRKAGLIDGMKTYVDAYRASNP